MGTLLGWTQNPGWPLAPLALAGAALWPLLVQEVLRAAVYLPLRRFGPWKAGAAAALLLAAAQCLPGWPRPGASGSLLPVLLEQGLPALVQSTLLTALLAVGGMLPRWNTACWRCFRGCCPGCPAANPFCPGVSEPAAAAAVPHCHQ